MPTRIERLEGRRLAIDWSDGQQRRYSVRELREKCPCATCRERRREDDDDQEAAEPDPSALRVLPVLKAEEARPLEVTAMRPAGQYAYNIQFSDGHNSGLFTFELLRQLGQRAEETD